MRTVFLLLVGYFLLTSPSFADSDTELRNRLVGNWEEVRSFDDEVHEHDIALRKDGTFEVKGVQRYLKQKTATKFTWRGNWGVEQGMFWYVTTYSSQPHLFPLGDRLEDKIISVSKSEWIMIEQTTGEKSVAHRTDEKNKTN